jgi:hypothetical protein
LGLRGLRFVWGFFLEVYMSENALSLYDKIADPMQAITMLGNSFAASGMFGCTNQAQGAVLAMTCMIEKRTPMEVSRTYHIISGKLSMRADAMLATLANNGGKYEWICTGEDKDFAEIKVEFKGRAGRSKFTIADANRAKINKKDSGWDKYPDAMLRARCVSKAMRIYAPELVSGYYTPEEIQDDADNHTTSRAPLFPRETTPVATEAIVLSESQPQPQSDIDTALDTIINGNEDAVNRYLIKIKFIEPDKTWREMSVDKKERLSKNPGAFIDAVIKSEVPNV